MGEDNKEVNEEKPKKKTLVTRVIDSFGKILGLFENVPKAVPGIALIISLVAGGTGAWGAMVAPENKDVKILQREVHDLQIWNQALRERAKCWDENKIQFDGYMLDLNSGDIEKLQK